MQKKKIDPSKIISYNEGLCITKSEYTLLKDIAIQEKSKILKEYNLTKANLDHQNKFIQHIISITEYNNLSNRQKEVMLINSQVKDDNQLIELLNNNGFTLEHIKTIIRFRDKIKNLMLYNPTLTKKLKEELEIYKKVVSQLIEIINKEFHINNSTIILNKICLLIVLYPELFESNNKHKNK